MENKRKIALSGVIAVAVVAAILAVALTVSAYDDPVNKTYNANSTFFVEENSTGAYCQNNTIVQIRVNTSVPSIGGALDIYFDPNCVNITAADFTNTRWGLLATGFTHNVNWVRMTSSNSPTMAPPNPNAYSGDNLFANITLHCMNNTDDCTSYLNFSGVSMGNETGSPIIMTTHNGTFNGTPTPKPDLDVDFDDPQHIFANLTNVMTAGITNIGDADAVGPFVVAINITRDCSPYDEIYSNATTVDRLNAGDSTTVNLGNWMPTTVENITINVTADYTNLVTDERDRSNNYEVEVRNTSCACSEYPTNPACVDCRSDTMSPETCYGYRGQHPMSTVYQGGSEVIYTVGDYKYKNDTVTFVIGSSGDTNRITNTTADIPPGATIVNATLYVYGTWYNAWTYGYDPTSYFQMSFKNSSIPETSISPVTYYNDSKEFTTMEKYQYLTFVYDVTQYVTGNDTYIANRTTPGAWGKGYTSGMALMVVYDDGSSSNMKYRIAHGCDRVATEYISSGRYQYHVTPDDATTNATFPEVDTHEVLLKDAKLFTVTVDGVDYSSGVPTKESLKFNDCPWYEGAWSNEMGASGNDYPIGFNRSNVTAYIADDGETAYFQERDGSYKNGFSAVFACLQTEEEPLKYVHPNSTFDPQNPIGSWWHELFPNFCTMTELTSWYDTNGDGEVSPCDFIDMTDELGEEWWYHVESVPYTLNLTKEGTGETMYIESELEWQDIDLSNPVCTQWHEIWPEFSREYHLSSWIDTQDAGQPGYGNLSHCDVIDLTDEETGKVTLWHVEEVEIDLILTSAPPVARKISVEPADVTVQPQDQFDVNITIDGNDIYAVEYYLKYNTSVVRAETQNKGPFLGNYGDTIVVINNIDQAKGIVSYAETRTGPEGVDGTGIVATIQFTAIGERAAETSLELFDVIIVDKDKNPVPVIETNNGTVTINNNIPPTARGLSKHRFNNVAKKYPCNTIICSCSYDENYPDKGGNITYIRWDFGDGQYGTSEGLPDANNCTCKNHTYESWMWAPFGDPYGDYVQFTAHLTVTDDGCPEETTTTSFPVTVYIAGDANGDGKVNILDGAYVGKHWSECCCDSGGCPNYPDPCDVSCSTCTANLWDDLQQDEADLNNDCNVNILDAMIIGANWGHVAW